MNTIKPLGCSKNRLPITVGELPTTFIESLSYYETLCVIIEKVNELIVVFNNVLEEKIDDYLNEHFNDIMVKTMYESATETLVLYLTQEGE